MCSVYSVHESNQVNRVDLKRWMIIAFSMLSTWAESEKKDQPQLAIKIDETHRESENLLSQMCKVNVFIVCVWPLNRACHIETNTAKKNRILISSKHLLAQCNRFGVYALQYAIVMNLSSVWVVCIKCECYCVHKKVWIH